MSDFTDYVQLELPYRTSIDVVAATGSMLVKVDNVFSRDYQALNQGTSGQVLVSQGSDALPAFTTLEHHDLSGLSDNDHLQYKMKTGFDKSIINNATLVINEATRTVTLTPVGGDQYYWIGGIKYTLGSAKSVVFNDTEGTWFIYFVGETLTASQTIWNFNDDNAHVAILYWDATNKEYVGFAYELHTWEISDRIHAYLHYTFRTRWRFGLTVTEAASEQLDVTTGALFDEDINITVTDNIGSGWWDQQLTPLSAPIIYRTGTAGYWRRYTTSTTPVILTSNIPQVNTWTGSTWQLENVATNRYFVVWVIGSSNINESVFLIPGQQSSDKLADTRDNNKLTDMAFGDLPVEEHKVLARVICQRMPASPYYQIIEIADYRDATDEPSGAGAIIGDHGALVGLGDDDHTQYHNDARAVTWLTAGHETTYNHTNYDTAYDWGDHSTAGYVPYTGATATVDLGSHILTTTGQCNLGVTKLAADNRELYFGADDDAKMYYDGVNLIVNPKAVGSGKFDVLGTLQTDGYNSADGTAGATTDIKIIKVNSTTKTLVFKNGLYTDNSDESTVTPVGKRPSMIEELGKNWVDMGQQFSETYIPSICYLGYGIMLFGTETNGKCGRSTDYGRTFTQVYPLTGQTGIMSATYLGNGIVLVGSQDDGKIARSTDYGATWSDLGQQGSETGIRSLCYLGNGIAVAGTYPNGHIFRSTDYGATWSDLGQQQSQATIEAIAYLGNGIAIAGTALGGLILRSTDYGANWTSLGQYGGTRVVATAAVEDGIALIGTSVGKVYRSTNYGATWTDVGQLGSETYALSLAYAQDGIVFAGTYSGGRIYRSTDYGATWSDLGQQGSETYVYSLCSLGGNTVMAGTGPNGHLYRTHSE